MKFRKHQRNYIKFFIMAVVFVALMPFTTSARESDEVVISTQEVETLSAYDVGTYWTEEKMMNALPMTIPEAWGTPTVSQESTSLSGEGVIANSGGPGDRPNEEIIPLTETALEPDAQFGTAPFSYTRYRIFPNKQFMYRKFPYRTVGKLFFTVPGAGNFVCSASSVNSRNRSVVWTAGHCVVSPGASPIWHTNFLFAPGRWEGNNPFGAWTPKEVGAPSGWATDGKLEYDHGALVMNLGGSGTPRKIGRRIGFLGFKANVSRQQHWHLHGYPAGPRDLGSTPPGAQFDGEHHEICAAAWGTNDLPTGTSGTDPETIGVGCDKTGGTSGGPWIVDFSGMKGQTNFLNGNNSYRYTGPNPPENLKLFSPYFGNAAKALRNWAQAIPVP